MIRYATYCKLKALLLFGEEQSADELAGKALQILAEDVLQDAGEGWRFLAPGEPLKEGDQAWDPGKREWYPRFLHDDFIICRRRIEQPPKAEPLTFGAAFAAARPKPDEPQYRVLEVGETIRQGDEFRSRGSDSRWNRCFFSVGEAVEHEDDIEFRRPINKENIK